MSGVQSLRSRPHLRDRLHPLGFTSCVAADFDPARLHCLRDLSSEIDLQQAVLEGRSLDFYMIFEIELTFERARRNPLMKVLMARPWTGLLLRLAARDGQLVLLGRDGDLIR
jgi:hypothetical protein